ncbi:MAG: hypothetical protein ACOYK6_05490 [Chthoniobacterales bacterium]
MALFSIDPLPYPAGKKLVPIGHLLSQARKSATGKAFVWCNSDVTLTRNPFEVPNPDQVYGFYRREIPSGEICHGVDMLYIPVSIWDTILSKNIPKLFLGASYVDWWIPRLMQHLGAYENLTGYIDHLSHPLSSASTEESNRYYQSNFNAYNRWARRHGLSTIPMPPVIPFLGHVWGIRDALQKIKTRL